MNLFFLRGHNLHFCVVRIKKWPAFVFWFYFFQSEKCYKSSELCENCSLICRTQTKWVFKWLVFLRPRWILMKCDIFYFKCILDQDVICGSWKLCFRSTFPPKKYMHKFLHCSRRLLLHFNSLLLTFVRQTNRSCIFKMHLLVPMKWGYELVQCTCMALLHPLFEFIIFIF